MIRFVSAASRARAARFGRRASRGRSLLAFRVLADATAIVGAFFVAFQIHRAAIGLGWIDRTMPTIGSYAAIAMMFALLTLLVFTRKGLYRGHSTVLNLWELETGVHGILLSAALLFALLFFLDVETLSRYAIVGSIGLSVVIVMLERRAVASLVRSLKADGLIGRRTLVYGCDRTGQLLMKKTVDSPHGATLVGFIDDHVPIGSTMCCRIKQTDPRLFEAPVLGRLEDLEEVVSAHDVEEILVSGPAAGTDRQREVLERASALGIKVGLVPSLGDIRSDQVRVEMVSAIPILRPVSTVQRRLDVAAKRVFDLVVGGVLLVLSLPAWGLAAALIRFGDPEGVLFAQQRVGKGGRPFRLLKFRTMTGSAPPYASSPAHDTGPDVTTVGRFLRRTGLDELPQLVNVLKGEMSLVGPRPEMPHLVQEYGPLERRRLEVKPGITGLWQLSADRHAEIHENIEYDLYYVNHQSVLLDALILVETALFTLGVLLGALDRRPTTAPSPDSTAPRALLPEDEYVLVALDQRWEGQAPETWRELIPAFFRLSDRWPVRVIVSGAHRREADRVVEETKIHDEPDVVRRFSFAPYGTRDELRRLTLAARLVVTDLKHVSTWTEDADIDLLFTEGQGLRWFPRTRVPDPIVSELSSDIPVYVGPRDERAAVGQREVPVVRLFAR